MNFVNFKLLSLKVAKTRYDLPQSKMIIYPSNMKYTAGIYGRNLAHKNLMEIIFYGKGSELDSQVLLRKFKEFTNFFAFFIPDTDIDLLTWLLYYDKNEAAKTTYPMQDIEGYISNNQGNIEKLNEFYKLDFNNLSSFPIPLIPSHSDISYDTLVFKFFNLHEDNIIKRSIKFLVYIMNTGAFNAATIDNDNIQKSNMYLLYESLANHFTTVQKLESQCRYCKKSITISNSSHQQIAKFIGDLEYIPDESKTKIMQVLDKFRHIRNKFVHAGKSQTFSIDDNKFEKYSDNGYMSFDNDVKYFDGRIGGYIFLWSIARFILFNKFLESINES